MLDAHSDVNTRARVHNSHARDLSAVLEPLAINIGANGPHYPNNFPATALILGTLSGKFVMNALWLMVAKYDLGADVNRLLNAYNLSTAGSVQDKRSRFGGFIGREQTGY